MAFNQLKKWVGTQLWSTFMTEYNENVDELNLVIAGVNENKAQLENLVASEGTLDVNSPEWRNVEGGGFYYFGGSAVDRGYPANYGFLLHIRLPGGVVILQVYIASAGRLWTRMINASSILEFVRVGK